MFTYGFIISTIVTGTIFSVLAVLAEKMLVAFGLVRGDIIGLLIGSLVLSFMRQLIDNNGNIWLYCLFVTIVAPLAVNRTDLITTMRKGRWWWESEQKS